MKLDLNFVGVLVEGGVIEYYRVTEIILTVLKGGRSKIKVPADSVPGESTLPGFRLYKRE